MESDTAQLQHSFYHHLSKICSLGYLQKNFMMQKDRNLQSLFLKNKNYKEIVMFLLLHLSFDERTCLSVEVRVSQGNVENFKHFTAKKNADLLKYVIETLYWIHSRQSKKLINNTSSYTEISFSKYRLAHTQMLLMTDFSSIKTSLRSYQIQMKYVY